MFKWRQIMVVKPLTSLREGETGKIVQISGKVPIHRYLYENGIVMGSSISVQKVESTPQDYSVIVKSADRVANLSKLMATNIRVKVPITVDERSIPNLHSEFVRVYTTSPR